MKKVIVAAVLVLAMGASSAIGAWAATQFSDVPAGHPFYDDIEWMAATGISEGYEDGTFRPGQPVSRQAMAAFMHRFAEGFEFVSQTTEYGMFDLWTQSAEQITVHPQVACPDGGRALAGGVTNAAQFKVWNERSEGGAWVVDANTTALPIEETLPVTMWAMCAPSL